MFLIAFLLFSLVFLDSLFKVQNPINPIITHAQHQLLIIEVHICLTQSFTCEVFTMDTTSQHLLESDSFYSPFLELQPNLCKVQFIRFEANFFSLISSAARNIIRTQPLRSFNHSVQIIWEYRLSLPAVLIINENSSL